MKNKHHPLGASLATSLVLVTTVSNLHGAGAVTTFTNREAWSTAVHAAGARGTTIFGFNFFPPLTYPVAISNQYAGAGFEFLAHDGRFPIPIDYVTNGVLSTPLFPNTGQTLRWHFTTPIHAVGWERTGADDTHVFRIFDTNNVELTVLDLRTPAQAGPIFGGFISDVPIGFASSFSDNNDQLHAIDNLRYAFIPERGPSLAISHRNTMEIILNWTTNATGYRLEFAESLPASKWNALTNVATITADRFVVSLTNSGVGQQYFRLHRP